MRDYIRTQVLLEKRQREQLDQIAELAGVSFSEIVREFLHAQLRIRTYQEMRRAAEALRDDYSVGGPLAEMAALDSEAFLNV